MGLLQSDINYDDLLFPVLLFLSQALKHISLAKVKAFPNENNYLHLTFPPSRKEERQCGSVPEASIQYSARYLALFTISMCKSNNVLNNSMKKN